MSIGVFVDRIVSIIHELLIISTINQFIILKFILYINIIIAFNNLLNLFIPTLFRIEILKLLNVAIYHIHITSWSLFQQEAEIARLQARVSGVERKWAVYNASATDHTQATSRSDWSYSQVEELKSLPSTISKVTSIILL